MAKGEQRLVRTVEGELTGVLSRMTSILPTT